MALPKELMGHSMVAPLARDLGSNVAQVLSYTELVNANSKGQNICIYTPITLTAWVDATGAVV